MATAEQDAFLRSLEEEKEEPARRAAAKRARFVRPLARVAGGGGLTVTIVRAAGQNSSVNAGPINFTVTFSRPVVGFINADISFVGSTVGGTLAAAVSGTGPSYNVAVTGMTGNGLVAASVIPAAATDAVTGTPTPGSIAVFVTFDTTAPSVTINQAVGQLDPTGTPPINFTAVFSKPVSGFMPVHVSFAGSTVGGTLAAAVSGSGTTYNIAVTGMTTPGNVVASIPAGGVIDAAGNLNLASTSGDNTVVFNAATPVTRNVTAVGNITVPLQAAINASADGDTVNITAGTCTAGLVTWANKNVIIRGQGIGATNITGLRFGATVTTKAGFRITAMSIASAGEWAIDAVGSPTPVNGWRIDNIAFDWPAADTQHIAVHITGLTYGLVDSCTFHNSLNAIHIDSFVNSNVEFPTPDPGPGPGNPGIGGTSWGLPFALGTDKAVYIEDCSFSNDSGGTVLATGDADTGARTVFRHNTVMNTWFQSHACRGGDRGGNCTCEIYNNTFDAGDPVWSGAGRAIHIRAGTGVIFNNVFKGFMNQIQCDNQRSNGQNTSTPYGAADGTHAWDGNLGTGAQAGWPCLDQIGRAPGQPFGTQPQTSQPLYVWSNTLFVGGATVSMVSDGDPNVQDGRDFINGVRPGYTAFTYPHPLRS